MLWAGLVLAKVAHHAAAAGADKLAPRAYDPVPLGAVMPSGWMKNRESDHGVGTPPCTDARFHLFRARAHDSEPCQLSLLRRAFVDAGLYIAACAVAELDAQDAGLCGNHYLGESPATGGGSH